MVTLEQVMERLNSLEKLLQRGASQNEILTVDEAANFCSLSKGHAYRLTCNKEIPHYKKNGRLFFRRSELSDWLLSFKVPTIEDRVNFYEK